IPAASAFTSILPFHPPLPVAWNLPFHPEEGSQTSTLMSESGDGLSIAATRQNAGRSVNCAPPPRPVAVAPPPRPPPCGGVNAPAATDCAIVMVASGSLSDESISHDCAATGRALNTRSAGRIVKRMRDLMTYLLSSATSCQAVRTRREPGRWSGHESLGRASTARAAG